MIRHDSLHSELNFASVIGLSCENYFEIIYVNKITVYSF